MQLSKEELHQSLTMYCVRVKLPSDFREYVKTEAQALTLATLINTRVLKHDNKVLQFMDDNTSISDPYGEKKSALKGIDTAIAYTEKIINSEVYEALKALEYAKYVLETDIKRYKKQQMITWLRGEYFTFLDGFTNKKDIVQALLSLAKNS